MTTASKLHAQLDAGDNLVAMGTWDILSAKVIQRAGFDIAALQSFQWAAGWGVPDIAIKTPSELLDLTIRMAGEIEIPILLDFEEGYGSPGHAAYWTQQFERAGAAALHVDDKGPVHMCPWLPGSQSKIRVSAAEYTADLIHTMAKSRRGDLMIVARCQYTSQDVHEAEAEELRRLRMYIEAGADVVFAPKTAILSNDLGKLTRAVKSLSVPVLIQFNPPDYIEGYTPKDAADGRSVCDRSFEELFACGIRIINCPQIYPVAYRALANVLTSIRKEGSLQPTRNKMMPFSEILELVGFDRFRGHG